jgi:hypothetical protein
VSGSAYISTRPPVLSIFYSIDLHKAAKRLDILGNTQGIISTFGWLQVDGVKTKWQPADLFALDSHCC